MEGGQVGGIHTKNHMENPNRHGSPRDELTLGES